MLSQVVSLTKTGMLHHGAALDVGYNADRQELWSYFVTGGYTIILVKAVRRQLWSNQLSIGKRILV